MWSVYKYTNILNQKGYIGYTCNLKRRQRQHFTSKRKTKFANACRKYGISAFKLEILYTTDDLSLAKNKEIELIQEHKTYTDGYNGTIGGDGVNPDVIKGPNNPNYKHKAWTEKSMEMMKLHHPCMKGEKNPFFGKTHSLATKKLISSKKTGRIQPPEERKMRSSINSMGKNPRAIPVLIDDILYSCIKEARQALNATRYNLFKLHHVQRLKS